MIALQDFGKAFPFKKFYDSYAPLQISGPSYGSAYKNTCKDLTFKSTYFSNHYFRPCAIYFFSKSAAIIYAIRTSFKGGSENREGLNT